MKATAINKKLNESQNAKDYSRFAKKEVCLEKNGHSVALSDEVAQITMERRSMANPFTLHNSVMVIDCDSTIDTIMLCEETKTLLTGSSIRWNSIVISPEASPYSRPSIFRCLKPSQLFLSAKRAGIVPSTLLITITAYTLIFIAGIFLAAMLHVMVNSLPTSLKITFPYFVVDRYFIAAVFGTVLAGWLFFTQIYNRLQIQNPQLHKMIADHAAGVSTVSHESRFAHNFREAFLSLSMPMALIVDEPEKLDGFTQQILSEVISHDDISTVGLVLWIIFRKNSEDPLSKSIKIAERTEGMQEKVTIHHYQLGNTCTPVVLANKAA